MKKPAKYFAQPRKIPYRTGLVVAQQITPYAAVRVQFPAHDNVVSYWLPLNSVNTQNNKDFWMPDIGEQVCVLMDENDEDGIVLGSIPSMADQTAAGFTITQRGTAFSDGTTIVYDRSTHQYKISIQSGSGPTFTANATGFTFQVGSVVLSITSSGVAVTGGATATQDIVAGHGGNNISLLNHEHGNVTIGLGQTSGPISGT